jgi:hypothetical protein
MHLSSTIYRRLYILYFRQRKHQYCHNGYLYITNHCLYRTASLPPLTNSAYNFILNIKSKCLQRTHLHVTLDVLYMIKSVCRLVEILVGPVLLAVFLEIYKIVIMRTWTSRLSSIYGEGRNSRPHTSSLPPLTNSAYNFILNIKSKCLQRTHLQVTLDVLYIQVYLYLQTAFSWYVLFIFECCMYSDKIIQTNLQINTRKDCNIKKKCAWFQYH